MSFAAMNMTTEAAALIVAHYVCALALLWSCICRFAHTTKANTRAGIRWAFGLLAAVAVACLFVPLASAWRPDRMHLALLLAIAVLQIVAAMYWRDGVPPAFRPDSCTRAPTELTQ